MTVQPTVDEPYFEMEDAYRWFAKRYTKIDPADLMSLCALDPPPGYADAQEAWAKKGGWDVPGWSHFRIYRERAAPTLAVILTVRSYVDVADDSLIVSRMIEPNLVTRNRIWLYEHRQGRGWVCLDPRDESHEVVRKLWAQMVLEALK